MIQVSISHPHVEVILNGPEGKPFTIDYSQLNELEETLATIEVAIQEQGIRLVVIKSSSPKFFCVGANINALKELDANTIEVWVRSGHRVFNRLENLSVPTVALVNGYTMGGGLELALCCDFIYAGPKAQFSQSEARLGFIPGWGGTRRLPDRIGSQQAKQLYYSGEMIDAQRGRAIGLVDQNGELDELNETLHRFEKSVCENSPSALAHYKAIIQGKQSAARDRNTDEEAALSISCMKNPDTMQRIDAFLNRKK